MPTLPRCRVIACVFALGLLAASAAHADLDAPSQARLAALQTKPEVSGELIYQGATFALEHPSAQPLFRYERRLNSADNTSWVASHLTRNPKGQLIILESAQFTPAYELQRFTVINQQGGVSGSAQLSADARRLNYSLNDNGKITSAEEEVDLPVITGPSMHGFILQHWDTLVAGNCLSVRLIVLQEMQTYGFDIRFEQQVDGQAAFSVTPSSLLIRLAVAPLRVVFDANSKNVLRYEGRVPPKQEVDGQLKDLDAGVDYVSLAAHYR
ncbi:MAG: hypothetical protein K2Y25_16165 [Pseudomonadaceae bacterium]|jgi:hypothetical protein|nr:hypothetical protein [Pseudomonadaceae bacterium]